MLMPLQEYGLYHRVDIARELKVPFNEQRWRQGVVRIGGHILLFITVDKRQHPPEHQYADRFLSDSIIEWKSQNREAHETEGGKSYVEHQERGVPVLVFARPNKLLDGKARPYYFLGAAFYVGSMGDYPMTVLWRLATPVRAAYQADLGVPNPAPTPASVQRALAEDPATWAKEEHVEPDPRAVGRLKAAIESGDHSAMDDWRLQKVRLGVRGFRTIVLTNFGFSCAVCGLNVEPLLDAAHVRAWAKDECDRLNPANGIALCVLHHRAYDRGLLMIEQDGTIHIPAWVARSENPTLSGALGRLGGSIRSPRFPVNLGR